MRSLHWPAQTCAVKQLLQVCRPTVEAERIQLRCTLYWYAADTYVNQVAMKYVWCN
jgi:hypothetical protein